MRRRLTWLVAGLTALALASAACGGETPAPNGGGALVTIEEGILTVGTDIPYPPFEFREGGEEVGFEIDLMDEIATRIGFDAETDVVYVDSDFETIFSDLAAAQFDLVIAASTITPEREEAVNFSDPYYSAQQSLTVNTSERSDIQSIDDLGEGDVVGVQDGTTGEAYTEENLAPNGVEVRAFPEGPDGYTALEAGQVDAVINDEPTAIAEVANRQSLELVETIPTDEFYGIAVNPENAELLDAVNEALADIIADGTYSDIYSRYPDLPPGGDITTVA